MRYPVAFFLLTPTLALAHSGPHLHPHGSDAMWLGVVGLVAAAGYALVRRRK
jgi:LPXTG-motif cell wall-anchored protein